MIDAPSFFSVSVFLFVSILGVITGACYLWLQWKKKEEKFNNALAETTKIFEEDIRKRISNNIPGNTNNIIKIYDNYFKYIISIETRRWKQHSFYFALYSVLFYCIFRYRKDVSILIVLLMGVFAFLISLLWHANLNHIRKELHIKYAFMKILEKFMPIRLFSHEFLSTELSGIKVNSNYEKIFVKAFIIISIINLLPIIYDFIYYFEI